MSVRGAVDALVGVCLAMLAAGPLPAAAEPTTHTVVIAEMKFTPQSLTVKRGDTVVWVNKDFFPHNVTAQDRTFASGDIATNRSWKYVATKAGIFPYVCTLHPTMQAALTIE